MLVLYGLTCGGGGGGGAGVGFESIGRDGGRGVSGFGEG
jgi:hypothetical protein